MVSMAPIPKPRRRLAPLMQDAWASPSALLAYFILFDTTSSNFNRQNGLYEILILFFVKEMPAKSSRPGDMFIYRLVLM